MTQVDNVGAAWLLKEWWGAPPEVISLLTDEENLAHMKSIIAAANGDGRFTDAEREWLIGYATAAGVAQSTIDFIKTYAGDDNFEDFFVDGVRQVAQRSCIWDAIRACGADGELSEDELTTLHRMAGRIGIPPEVVDEFVDMYNQEQALKARRIQLAFPQGMPA